MHRRFRPLRHEPLEGRLLLAAGDIDWLRQFGSVLPGTMTGSAVGASGSIYVGGSTSGALPGQTSAGSVDAFVRRYDAAGNVVWTRQFGSAGGDFVQSIAADGTDVYVVGVTAGALPGQTFVGGVTDAFLRKYDADGNELWTRQFGSTFGGDAANDVVLDSTGIYVAGAVHGPSSDVYVRKYDAGGNLLWNHEFGSDSGNLGRSLALNDSGVYVSGSLGGPGPGLPGQGGFVRKFGKDGNTQWTFHTSPLPAAATGGDSIAVDASGFYVAGTIGGFSDGSNSDVLVSKFDFAGNQLWSQQFGATVPAGRVITDRAWDIAVDASGVYVAGESNGFLNSPIDGTGAFLRKYDVSGTVLWTRHFGPTNFADLAPGSAARGINLDGSGVYVVGDTSRLFPGQTSTGGTDTFVRKFDAGGNEVWTRQFSTGAPATDVARAVDADGNVYVAG